MIGLVSVPGLGYPTFISELPPGILSPIIMGDIRIIQWIESMSMAIFYSYVPLPEGIGSQIIKWRFPNQIGGTPTAGWLTVENSIENFDDDLEGTPMTQETSTNIPYKFKTVFLF